MNNITPENIDQLIVRCLAKEAEPQEIAALQQWIRQDAQNERYYDEMLFIYEQSAKINHIRPVDVDAAWAKVRTGIALTETKVVPIYPKRNKLDWKVWSAAASLLVVCALGFLWYTQAEHGTLHLASSDKPAAVSLSDGSQVSLEAHSSLVQVTKGKREYKLQGQASFDVVHDDKDPFIIHTDDAMIKDVGTVFKVSYVPKNDTVRVKVTEGVVQFYTLKDSGIMLAEGESGYYLRSSRKFYKHEAFKDSNSVRLTIDFDNVTLEEVVTKLSANFKQEIVIENEEIKMCRFTAHFEQNSLNEMLDILSDALGIWRKEKDGKIILAGKGCH